MYISLPIALLMALVTSTVAHSGGGGGKGWTPQHGGGGGAPSPPPSCLNTTGVNTLVDGYTYLLEHPGGADFNVTAEAILSDTSFVVESDSILTLSGRAVRNKSPISSLFSFSPLPLGIISLDL